MTQLNKETSIENDSSLNDSSLNDSPPNDTQLKDGENDVETNAQSSAQSLEQISEDTQSSSSSSSPTLSQQQEQSVEPITIDDSRPTDSDETKQPPPPPFNELQFSDATFRPSAVGIGEWLENTNLDALNELNDQAADIFYRKGVTFTVYSDAKNIERMIPFDIIPRIITSSEWQHIEKGCQQRITALNMFLDDIYHSQRIMKAGIVPDSYVYASGCYEPWMMNIKLDKPVYSHISGIDLIRDESGNFCVLEDNLRTPSGVSYMLESRNISKMLLSDVYEQTPIMEIGDYPQRLKACLASASNKYDPQIVILTPGRFNSAYYEHAFLAREMKVPLVHGYDLLVENGKVYMQGIRGKVQIDIIYRRIDDPFLDPLGFRSDSIMGVSGLMSAYRAGNVVIVNAPGTGVADDKSLYPFVPDMIEFYLGEKPLLPNITTYQCRKEDDLDYVLNHLDKLVVKETQGSGGYGMLIGPSAGEQEINAYRKRLLDNPAGFIAQPTISLSTNPTTVDDGIALRHIDLRPFVLSHGDGTVDIVPGGLTRVAMVKGSLVVNSSQGGGIKDTWVIDAGSDEASNISATSKLNNKRNEQAPSQSTTVQSTPDGKSGGKLDLIAARHTYYTDTAYPVEVGYENLNKAPMILLLSTANHLVWLGRHSERLRHYDSIMNKLIKHELDELQLRHLIMSLGFKVDCDINNEVLPEGTIALGILQDLESAKIPDVIAAIETNVQEVKGVIGRDTAELYNLIKRLASAGTYRAATLQLQACNAAMLQEHPTVTCFWQLGRRFEQLERSIMLGEDIKQGSLAFKKWVNELPENTRWRELIRLTNQLINSQNFDDYLLLSQEFNTILQQGV